MSNVYGEVILTCEKINKNFGPTRALVDVDFTLHRGEICGLIGENGSGKSTLTSIIAGAQKAVSGNMTLKGKPYAPSDMMKARANGVASIVQENGMMSGLTVAANIFVGNMKQFRKKGIISVGAMQQAADSVMESIGAPEIKGSMLSDTLNFEDRKIVEIGRAMYLDPDVLIVDETTTALAQRGRDIIYALIKKMQTENKAVIFISHDLEELVDVCNSIKVLRDGHMVGSLEGDAITPEKMREMMVGRKMQDHYMRADYDPSCGEEVVLEARHISSADGYIKNLDLQLHGGEILGLGGLANSGMHEVGKMLFGINEHITGEVVRGNKVKDVRSPVQAIANGMGYIAKDRDKESILLNASIQDNIVLASLGLLQKGGVVTPKSQHELSDRMVEALRIKCVSGRQACKELSGGNKQKVAFSKWIGTGCDVLIMDCPTRGIDIGVKASMYDLIYELKKQGKAIIMISEELVELIGMSDRMLIFKDGSITKELYRSPDITDSDIIGYMI